MAGRTLRFALTHTHHIHTDSGHRDEYGRTFRYTWLGIQQTWKLSVTWSPALGTWLRNRLFSSFCVVVSTRRWLPNAAVALHFTHLTAAHGEGRMLALPVTCVVWWRHRSWRHAGDLHPRVRSCRVNIYMVRLPL